MQRRQFSQIAAATTTAGGASSSAATRASVNTLFLATFTYRRGIAGRQVPDHGKQEYDTNFHGGNYAKIHPEFYRDTVMKTFAPEGTKQAVMAAFSRRR